MDHDRLFKELLTVFFVEFVALFLPDVAVYLDAGSLEFLDKEVFTDVTSGDRHEVDVVVKARFREEEAFFLIHVENQASAQSDFPRRMFRYFARLHDKYDLPVYPVVLFSYDAPRRAEPTRYKVAFPGRTVLQFDYRVIQLNRLPWRRFVQQTNPVATALMAKMKMAPRDRPRVKLECLRLLATLKLDPSRSELIGGFVELYLKLSAEENRQFERERAKLMPEVEETNMTMWTSWGREGYAKGEQEGKEGLVARQLSRRFGSLSSEGMARLNRMPADLLDELGVALFDFASLADVENWLREHDASAEAQASPALSE